MAKVSRQIEGTRSDEFLRAAMKEHGAHVLHLALVMTGSYADAEDVYQDVFIKLATSQGEFESSDHLRAWLLHVTANFCRNYKTTWWQKHTTGFDELIQEPADPATLTDEPLVRDPSIQINGYSYSVRDVIQAILRLPQKYRAVIYLTYYEDLSTSSVARILAQNPSTIRTRLQRARERLRVILDKQRSSYAGD